MENAETILAIYKQDEARGLRLLYDTYYEVLLLYAHGIIGEAGAAEDVIQECFISFWARDRLRGLPDGLERYLFRAVKYASLNYVRGRQRRQNLHASASREMPGTDEAPNEEDTDDMAVLLAAINRLPDERRKIFLMICVDGHSYKETAEKLDISINTVKTQMTRSVKFLREQLKNHVFTILLSWILRDAAPISSV
ncbi:MAG: sigma-70 family RNA polymerase sigma factor [Odoribacteraceae bacterium]|jgi:RNA polymerase sigma-70 factor (ECF subfamily)|nr:sigma-70 family RNA polymerase sigma factor [Odoribacteraceae bacterium]